MKVRLNSYSGFSDEEFRKLSRAINILESLVCLPEFRTEILAREYRYTKLTPIQIWNKLQEAMEVGTSELDSEIDIDITIYNSGWFGRRTVGYTYGYTLKTWINRKFFLFLSDEKIAGNLLHEWSHNLGFGHPFKSTKDRNLSVPYQMNSIIDKLYKAHYL